MSFLNSNNSEFLSARITQKGRNSIAKGNFNIEYFQIGDSEFDYTSNLKYLTGSLNGQKVFAPLDKDTQLKYPLLYLSGSDIQYGVPVTGSTIETIKNTMGTAGFVSGSVFSTGSLIVDESFSSLSGTTGLTVTITSGTTFGDSEYVTLLLKGVNGQSITGNTNSYVYKLVSVSGLTSTTELLTFDRPTPNLTGLTGNFYVVGNYCDNEFLTASDIDNGCLPNLPDNDAQHNPWTLNTIFTKNPIGFTEYDSNFSGFTSAKHVGTKEFLGYTSDEGQIFIDTTGGTITGTSYVNIFGEEIEVKPSEQDRKSTRLNSSHTDISRMPSSA